MYLNKAGNISEEDGGVVSKVYYFNLIASCLYSLILLLALMKLASTSAAIMYKSIENRHPWQTSRVRVKGSDRRPFILILDWILVYTSLTIWMNLSPYPKLCKAEKLKIQSTLRISQKDFYSVIWHINYVINNRKM